VLPDEVLHDYSVSVAVGTLHENMLKEALISYKRVSREMIENVNWAKMVVEKVGLPMNYVKNANVLTMGDSHVMEKKSVLKSTKLVEQCEKRMKLLEGIHVNRLQLEYLEYNRMLERANENLKMCMRMIKQADSEFMTPLMSACIILARVGRLEFIDEFAELPVINTFDQKITNSIVNIKALVSGIEKYQHGLWLEAAMDLNAFCSKETYFCYQRWVRVIERAWYLAIT